MSFAPAPSAPEPSNTPAPPKPVNPEPHPQPEDPEGDVVKTPGEGRSEHPAQ